MTPLKNIMLFLRKQIINDIVFQKKINKRAQCILGDTFFSWNIRILSKSILIGSRAELDKDI